MQAVRLALVACLTAVPAAAWAVSAEYTATLETLWSRSSHPNNFPSSAHFSRLIGASHSNNVSFWAPGQSATPGIEAVAELGSTSTFQSEITAARRQQTALDSIQASDGFLSPGESTNTNQFTVDSGYPLLTLATMIAPSSDWFIGVHGLDLREGPGFVEELVIDFASFYDAGTEEGSGFSLSNPATSPRGVITHVTGAAAAEPFVGDAAIPLPPIARLTITRQSITGLPGDFNGDGLVTGADLGLWSTQFGQLATGLSADGNNDGRVDAADYTVWRDALPAGAVAVPEPATVWFLVVAAGFFRRR